MRFLARLSKAKKPYGHVAYVKHAGNKLVQVKQKGAKPAEMKTWATTPALAKKIIDEFRWGPKYGLEKPDGKVQYIPIDDVSFADCRDGDDGCGRCEGSDDYMSTMQALMAKGGKFGPVIVHPEDGEPGKYYVTDGNHRMAVAADLGYTHVPALITGPAKTKKAFIVNITKAKKPYGHTAYTRTAHSGQVAFIPKKGVKPIKVSAPRKPPVAAESNLDIPEFKKLTKIGDGSNLGGAGEKSIYEDKKGKKWLYKLAASKDGERKPKPFAAYIQEATAQVTRIVKPDASIPVGVVQLPYDEIGTIQPLVANKGTLENIPPNKLSTQEKEDVAAEHLIDWLMSQHDSHGANFLRVNGRIIGTDKEQGFKYFKDDQLDTEYHPNESYGEQEPYYNKFWRAWGEGKFEFNPLLMSKYVDAIEAIPDAQYKKFLTNYATEVAPHGADGFLLKAAKRKSTLRRDFENFISHLYHLRTGEVGTFTFAKGWNGTKPGKTAEPALSLELICGSTKAGKGHPGNWGGPDNGEEVHPKHLQIKNEAEKLGIDVDVTSHAEDDEWFSDAYVRFAPSQAEQVAKLLRRVGYKGDILDSNVKLPPEIKKLAQSEGWTLGRVKKAEEPDLTKGGNKKGTKDPWVLKVKVSGIKDIVGYTLKQLPDFLPDSIKWKKKGWTVIPVWIKDLPSRYAADKKIGIAAQKNLEDLSVGHEVRIESVAQYQEELAAQRAADISSTQPKKAQELLDTLKESEKAGQKFEQVTPVSPAEVHAGFDAHLEELENLKHEQDARIAAVDQSGAASSPGRGPDTGSGPVLTSAPKKDTRTEWQKRKQRELVRKLTPVEQDIADYLIDRVRGLRDPRAFLGPGKMLKITGEIDSDLDPETKPLSLALELGLAGSGVGIGLKVSSENFYPRWLVSNETGANTKWKEAGNRDITFLDPWLTSMLRKEWAPFVRDQVQYRGSKIYGLPKELVQATVTAAMAALEDYARVYEPMINGNFNTYIRSAVDGFIRNHLKETHKMKERLEAESVRQTGDITESNRILAQAELGVDPDAEYGRQSGTATGTVMNPEEEAILTEAVVNSIGMLGSSDAAMEHVDDLLGTGRYRDAAEYVMGGTKDEVADDYHKAQDNLREAQQRWATAQAEAQRTNTKLSGQALLNHPARLAMLRAQSDYFSEKRRLELAHAVIVAVGSHQTTAIRGALESYIRENWLAPHEAFAFRARLNFDDAPSTDKVSLTTLDPTQAAIARGKPIRLPTRPGDPPRYLAAFANPERKTHRHVIPRSDQEIARMAEAEGLGSFSEWVVNGPAYFRAAVEKLEKMPRGKRSTLFTALTGLSKFSRGARMEMDRPFETVLTLQAPGAMSKDPRSRIDRLRHTAAKINAKIDVTEKTDPHLQVLQARLAKVKAQQTALEGEAGKQSRPKLIVLANQPKKKLNARNKRIKDIEEKLSKLSSEIAQLDKERRKHAGVLDRATQKEAEVIAAKVGFKLHEKVRGQKVSAQPEKFYVDRDVGDEDREVGQQAYRDAVAGEDPGADWRPEGQRGPLMTDEAREWSRKYATIIRQAHDKVMASDKHKQRRKELAKLGAKIHEKTVESQKLSTARTGVKNEALLLDSQVEGYTKQSAVPPESEARLDYKRKVLKLQSEADKLRKPETEETRVAKRLLAAAADAYRAAPKGSPKANAALTILDRAQNNLDEAYSRVARTGPYKERLAVVEKEIKELQKESNVIGVPKTRLPADKVAEIQAEVVEATATGKDVKVSKKEWAKIKAEANKRKAEEEKRLAEKQTKKSLSWAVGDYLDSLIDLHRPRA